MRPGKSKRMYLAYSGSLSDEAIQDRHSGGALLMATGALGAIQNGLNALEVGSPSSVTGAER